MRRMNNHVPTIETSKKLKEAGYPQSTIHVWVWTTGGQLGVMAIQTGALDKFGANYCAAPILTEILEQLPVGIHIEKWIKGTYLFSEDFEASGAKTGSDNPVEAAALLWLELKSAGHVTKD